jgi:type 1 glutamine amidotransferase
MLQSTRIVFAFVALALLLATTPLQAAEKLKVLLIDGQNNHNWKATSPVIKWILEESGRFTVDVSTTPPKGNDHEAWKNWHPHFADYAAVVSNYNGQPWPEEVRKEFVEYVRNGGGFVSVHAADNSFPEWPEYNQMIGVGGWGGRNEKSGPMIRFRDGKFVHDDTKGAGGAHGKQHEFLIVAHEPEHPILKGLPEKWMAATDELYSKLRGPAENMTVLATAYSDPATNGTGENEPILMVIHFGKGRVFHTTLGHAVQAMTGLGFQVTLARGTEWVATGEVTLPPPAPDVLKADHATINLPPESVTGPVKGK